MTKAVGAEPWGLGRGTHVKATPIMILDVENLIVDAAPKIKGKRTLSDHGAVWVRYRLSWMAKNR